MSAGAKTNGEQHERAPASLIEQYRERAVTHVMGLKSMKKLWNARWRTEVLKRVGDPPDPMRLVDLGDELSSVFKSTREGGRKQKTLSGGGAAWECLICWYCNLCMIGSRVVFIKFRKSLIPEPIRDAITVSYRGVDTTSEADVMAIVFPDMPEYTKPRDKIPNGRFLKMVNDMTHRHFDKHEVGIISCKTNWNDSAQIPMLWDMVYRRGGVPELDIIVGTSDHFLTDLRKFTYSFVTVPTTKIESCKSDNLVVRRVTTLSGGNYWGYETRKGVAKSLKQIFGNNFRSGYTGTRTRDREIRLLRDKYPYFGLHG